VVAGSSQVDADKGYFPHQDSDSYSSVKILPFPIHFQTLNSSRYFLYQVAIFNYIHFKWLITLLTFLSFYFHWNN
jgi:hypothetical protein